MNERCHFLLAQERKSATFDSEIVKAIIYESSLPERKRVKQLLASDENGFRRDVDVYADRSGKYEHGIEKMWHFTRFVRKHKLNDKEISVLLDLLGESRPDFVIIDNDTYYDDNNRVLEVHVAMFLPTLLSQADEEQRAKWLPLASSYKVIGTYAQTELGHGSNVRGLETTAHFDVKTDEFLLNTPTLSAMKWWPGGLARTCNHALVMARLILPKEKGGDLGIHPFIVQLRSFDDHSQMMPGVTTGDIGTKFGLNHLDNGFLILKDVRIPRTNMLMKFSKVTKDGEYVKPPNPRLSYGTMIHIRSGMVKSSGAMLGKALTIAIRFCAQRHQGFAIAPGSEKMNYNGPEMPVLNYITAQYRLFPYLATSYAFFFLGRYMWSLHIANSGKISQKDGADLTLLEKTHALSSGLKAYATVVVSDGIEECRRTCGGHGYADYSGFHEILGVSLMNLTGEGEAYLLPLQTAKYLLRQLMKNDVKHMTSNNKGNLNISISKMPVDEKEVMLLCVDLLQHRAETMLNQLKESIEEKMKISKDMNFENAFQASYMLAVQASNAHCLYFTASVFADQVFGTSKTPPITTDIYVLEVFKDLFFLFAMHNIDKYSGDLMIDGYLSGRLLSQFRKEIEKLMAKIRVNCLALCDAYDFIDLQLNTAFLDNGKELYENIFDFVKNNVPENNHRPKIVNNSKL